MEDKDWKLFIKKYDKLQAHLHLNAVTKGFWPPGSINIGEKLALVHAEVSEALEATREGDPDSEKISGFSLLEEELADVVIRIMDISGHLELNIAEAMRAKTKYNKTRPYRHNKKF